MKLYLDASALVKRYVSEAGSSEVREAMGRADGWFACRVVYVETTRALGLATGKASVASFREEWPAFSVIEVDKALTEDASALAVKHELCSLDALHLAAALVLPSDELVLATWDRRLHAAGSSAGLELLPRQLDSP